LPFALFFRRFNFFACSCCTDSIYRPILLLCSSFCFSACLRITPHPQSELYGHGTRVRHTPLSHCLHRHFLLNFPVYVRQITSNNLSSFNTDFILKSNCNFCRHLLYFYQVRFLCSLLKIVLQFQSLHNGHTDHCYVMSFAAGKRLNVIITIMKTVQCYVSCLSRYAKGGASKIFLTSELSEIVSSIFKTVAPPLPG